MKPVQDALTLNASPFHDRAAEHCRTNAWIRAGRLTLVEVYSAVEEEYWALKAEAGLADLSYLRCYRVSGAEARAGLEHLVTRRLDAQKPGEQLEVLWCGDTGAVIGAGRLLMESPDSFLLVTEEPCRAWLEDTLGGYACAVAELSANIARLGLAGPAAQAVLEAMGLTLARQLQPQQFLRGALRGLPLGVARHDLERFELWLDRGEARVLWDRLIFAGKPLGLKPAGTAAQTIRRLELGTPRQGVDFMGALSARYPAEMVRPEALGFHALVDLTKPGFVGQRALGAPLRPGRRLLRLLAETAEPIQGAIIAGKDQRAIGYLTSSAYAPALGASLAFGWVEREPEGPIGLVLPPDAGSAGKLRQIPCRIA
jgi:glycine cleavage system aminomethyltransferase T